MLRDATQKGIVAISALLLTLAWSSNIAAAATPTVTIDAPSSISYTERPFSRARSIRTAAGNGGLVFYYFEYREPGAATWTRVFGGLLDERPKRKGTDPVPVATDLKGLERGTEYVVRLNAVVEKASTTPRQTDPSFTTLPAVAPKILAVRITALETEAEVQVEIDPGALATTYHARYGPTTALGAVSVEKLIEGEVPAKGTIAIGGP